MKKLVLLFTAVFLLYAAPAMSDALIMDVDTTSFSTQFGPYWDDNDTNPDLLSNSGEAAEEMWLEAVLGLEYNDPKVNFVYKEETNHPVGNTAFSGYDPGYDWIYAVVKIGKGQGRNHDEHIADHYAFMDDGDGLLTPMLGDSLFKFEHAVSHVSFYGAAPVPEPATMLLLGTGLIALAGIGRKKIMK